MLDKLQNNRNALGLVFMLPAAVLLLLFLTYPLGLGVWLGFTDTKIGRDGVWIGIENGRLVAIDQGTTNGTYVNDIARGRITRAELRDGDTVIVSEPDCCSLQVKLG